MDGNDFGAAAQNSKGEEYTERGRKENSNTSTAVAKNHLGDKKKNTIKFIIFSIVLIILCSVGTVIFLLYNNRNSDADDILVAEEELSVLSNEVYWFDSRNEEAIPYEELEMKLENFISNNENNEKLHSRSMALLAQLYFSNGNPRLAVETIEDYLERDISNNTRLSLLIALAYIYEQGKETNGLIKTLEKIIALPDDIELSQESWPLLKDTFREQLQQLKTGAEDEN